jgi:hypothetical protein
MSKGLGVVAPAPPNLLSTATGLLNETVGLVVIVTTANWAGSGTQNNSFPSRDQSGS